MSYDHAMSYDHTMSYALHIKIRQSFQKISCSSIILANAPKSPVLEVLQCCGSGGILPHACTVHTLEKSCYPLLL